MKSIYHQAATVIIGAIISMPSLAAVERIDVRPSDTDPAINQGEEPHIVLRDGKGPGAPLLIFLPGTGGLTSKTVNGEKAFIDVAISKGYRFIILSYKDTPAVSQVCTAQVLRHDSNCAEKMRQKRALGENATSLITDEPQDAIVHRITALIRYLAKADPQGNWNLYLDGEHPTWRKIILSGQSQGGGMAAFIGKQFPLGGVIDFSGGWDMRSAGRIADWYAKDGATPTEHLYGTFHVQEKFAKLIAESYAAMRMPQDHQFALDKPIRNAQANNPGHGEGATNPIYRDVWETMLDGINPRH